MTKEQYQEEQSALVCQDQVNSPAQPGLVSMQVAVPAEQPPPNSHAHFRLNWTKFIGHFLSKLAQPSNPQYVVRICSLQRVETFSTYQLEDYQIIYPFHSYSTVNYMRI